MSPGKKSVRGCLVALAMIAAIVLVRQFYLGSPFGRDAPLLLFIIPILAAAWIGDWKSGLLATLASAAAGSYLFIDRDGWWIVHSIDRARIIRLLCVGGIISWLFEALHAAQRGYQASLAEITSNQQRLTEATENLRLVTDGMSVAVSRCSRDLRYAWVSKSYADWLNSPIENIVGRPIVDVLGSEAFADLLPYFERVLAGEQVQYERVVNFPSLGKRWINATYSPTFEAGETRPTGWVAAVLDVTERKRIEEALNEANLRKDEFVALMAHELRNPLAPLSDSMATWPLVEHDAERMRQLRDVMDHQVQQMVRLIDDLMDVSRIGQGKVELRKEPVEIAQIAHRAAEMVRSFIAQRGHDLSISLPSETLWVDGDSARLIQVLGNILHNAAKFTEPGGAISLVAARQAEQAVIKIKDNGIGISPTMRSQVFEMFRQVEQGSNRSHVGLGIGLNLAKRLIEMHGGSIEVASDGPGHGSEFTISLATVAAPAKATAAKAPEPAETAAVGQHRVLVVDDLPEVAESFATLLRVCGQDVSVAHDGQSAIAMVLARPPDVVFLDIAMPGMSGYEVARILRGHPSLNGLPLVALTGYGQDSDRQKAMEAGFDHHMTKPTDLDALKQLLRGVASREQH